MSLCASCGHQEGSWQHHASCQPVEAKVPNPSRRHLEEVVPSRVPRSATSSATRGATAKVVAPEGVERSETPAPNRSETSPRSETPPEVSEQPKKGGRPKKWASDAERMKAARGAKKGVGQ